MLRRRENPRVDSKYVGLGDGADLSNSMLLLEEAKNLRYNINTLSAG